MRRSGNGPRRNPGSRGDQRRHERGGGTSNKVSNKGIGGEQVEGRRAVRELLAAEQRRVREVWIADGANENDVLSEIVDLARDHRIPIKTVGRESLLKASHSDAPQGVLAYAEPLHEYALEELIDPESNPFLLAFDGVTDPHNLGALIRTGECSGVTGVILPKHRSVHVTPTVAKASAGAIEHVPIAMVAGLPAALSDCKESGVWTVGLDMDGDTDIHDLTVADQPLVLVFGAEGKGLSRLTKQRCDVLARIPQYGNVASLNVSAAGAIACFEVARKRAL
jgi:23S rRNA (guanosine2251-2'-O)-methyltransferase